MSLFQVKPVVGPNEFPMLGNLRTLFLDECDLRDNFRILRHFLQRCPNLEKLTIRLCEVGVFNIPSSPVLLLLNLAGYG
jgi:hypothetical protein